MSSYEKNCVSILEIESKSIFGPLIKILSGIDNKGLSRRYPGLRLNSIFGIIGTFFYLNYYIQIPMKLD